MSNECLLEKIQEIIKNTPKAIAAIHEEEKLTYQQLGYNANRLSLYLKSQQVKKGSVVVLFMRRSPDVLVSILAIWQLGASYLPLDYETPKERIKKILKEVQPSCIISEPALLLKIPKENIPVITLKDPEIDKISTVKNVSTDLTQSSSKDLAYIMYTSESTGNPKRVIISQTNLKNHIDWLIETFNFSNKDVFSWNSPVAFDFSVPCMLAPLIVGATIIISSESDIFAIERYCQQLITHQVSFVKWTPSYFRLLIEYARNNQLDLSSFRYLMVAGEPFLTTLAQNWFEIFPSHTLVSEYSPTETSVGITGYIFNHKTLNTQLNTVPIGKAVSNSDLYVVDAESSLLNPGKINELLIGSKSVGLGDLGYYQAKEQAEIKSIDLTNEKFIGNCFSKSSEKLYRTGDLVKCLKEKQNTASDTKKDDNKKNRHAIAIIALECKFPGAENSEKFWEICKKGKETISFFNKKNYSALNKDHEYWVDARGVLENIDQFDAAFFQYSPKEAHLSDPQHRLFLEIAWTALERAGYGPGNPKLGALGVYASMNDSTYIVDQGFPMQGKKFLDDTLSSLRLMRSQFLATQLAYELNATGPAITLQAACSSSLVSVVLACQQLSSFECDTAIAGGVSITTPQNKPYLYQPGNIFSSDGHCRPFDAHADGTVFSNGLGIVVLKRLSDALRDNDTILSVITGYSMNNDDHDKINYSAPSISSQKQCILDAQRMAGIKADTIQYVEADGTGTLLGDPIEFEALSKAFSLSAYRHQFCAIGSLKANIGHTHVAAGIGGLIKTVLALKNQEIPPSINIREPNPNIDFTHSPFYINTRLQTWQKGKNPRRAAVSAFGVGSTNAHVILEEAPSLSVLPSHRQFHSILFSAKNELALKAYNENLINYLEKEEIENPSASIADICYTLLTGRKHYPHRYGIIIETISDAIKQLKRLKHDDYKELTFNQKQPQIIFLFPGQGTQYLNLSLKLYNEEQVYRKHLDHCLDMASFFMKVNLKKTLFPSSEDLTEEIKIFKTEFAHPILFSVEYALAQLLINYGIKPNTMLGHSLGEYVTACIAGVFKLEDALKLVCIRGRSVAKCTPGEMLSIPLPAEEVSALVSDSVEIAAINSPNLCVVSGKKMSLKRFQKKLEPILSKKSLNIQNLTNNYPSHSHLLKDAIPSFSLALESIPKRNPTIPFLSNLTGDWITSLNIQSNDYWINHMLKPVRFSDCSKKLIDSFPNAIFIEVGAGSTLVNLLQQHTEKKLKTITLLPNAFENSNQVTIPFIKVLKNIWNYGPNIDWEKYYENEKRNHIPLPTYPFQRQKYWFDQVTPDEKIISDFSTPLEFLD